MPKDFTRYLIDILPQGGHWWVQYMQKHHGPDVHGWQHDNVSAHVAESLIRKGADVNARGGMQDTPLHWAAHLGPVSLVQSLVNCGADVNARDYRKQTPLHWSGDENVVQALIDNGSDINAQDSEGNTLLHSAACRGRLKMVKVLVRCRAMKNPRNCDDVTPLYLAIDNMQWQAGSYLIKRGALVNVQSNTDGNTPLHLAVLGRNFTVAKQLVRQGAKRDIENANGNTPLVLAESIGGEKAVQILEDAVCPSTQTEK